LIDEILHMEFNFCRKKPDFLFRTCLFSRLGGSALTHSMKYNAAS